MKIYLNTYREQILNNRFWDFFTTVGQIFEKGLVQVSDLCTENACKVR